MKKLILIATLLTSSVFAESLTVKGSLLTKEILADFGNSLAVKVIKISTAEGTEQLLINPRTMHRHEDCIDGTFEIRQATSNEHNGYNSYDVFKSSCD